MLYQYFIDLDERGEFFADVRDVEDNTVFEIHGFQIFEDGFMSDKYDLSGLYDYLIALGILADHDTLIGAQEYA